MAFIGEFLIKIIGISDKKKLKDNSKTYTYGAFTIRSQHLDKYIGKEVVVKVFEKDKKKQEK